MQRYWWNRYLRISMLVGLVSLRLLIRSTWSILRDLVTHPAEMARLWHAQHGGKLGKSYWGNRGNKGKCARNVMARDAVIVRRERVKMPVGYMQTMKSFGGWGNLFILLAFPRICSTPQAT